MLPIGSVYQVFQQFAEPRIYFTLRGTLCEWVVDFTAILSLSIRPSSGGSCQFWSFGGNGEFGEFKVEFYE
jgi:hypothetical protein